MFEFTDKTPFTARLPIEFLNDLHPLDETITSNYCIEQRLREQYGLDETYRKAVQHWVYIGRHNLAQDRKDAKAREMTTQGYKPLTLESIKAAYENGRRLELTSGLRGFTGIFRVVMDAQGKSYWLLPPHHTKRGYSAAALLAEQYHPYTPGIFAKTA